MSKYYDCWKCWDDVENDYHTDTPPDKDIIYAGYTYEWYSGNALLVFTKNGKLYENNDSHCSCNGLERWNPEETSVSALLMRQDWPGLHETIQRTCFDSQGFVVFSVPEGEPQDAEERIEELEALLHEAKDLISELVHFETTLYSRQRGREFLEKNK